MSKAIIAGWCTETNYIPTFENVCLWLCHQHDKNTVWSLIYAFLPDNIQDNIFLNMKNKSFLMLCQSSWNDCSHIKILIIL